MLTWFQVRTHPTLGWVEYVKQEKKIMESETHNDHGGPEPAKGLQVQSRTPLSNEKGLYSLLRMTPTGRVWAIIQRTSLFKDDITGVEYATFQLVEGWERVNFEAAKNEIVRIKKLNTPKVYGGSQR